MANYNSGLFYNSGENYNSAFYYIIEINDTCNGFDETQMSAQLPIEDVAIGVDSINKVSEYPASQYLVVTSDNIFYPMGVRVLRDSKIDFFTNIKEVSENVPGRHGAIKFDSKLGARIHELHVATMNETENVNLESIRREFAKLLNPLNGNKDLVFLSDEKKSYSVKYAGKITPNQYANWMEFTIPFKMSNPIIMGTFEQSIVGDGIALNEGNIDTPFNIIITGPITNPSIQIGNITLSYDGYIEEGSSVICNTEDCTAFLDGTINVIDKINGALPLYLPVGSIEIVTSTQVKLIWRSRWK